MKTSKKIAVFLIISLMTVLGSEMVHATVIRAATSVVDAPSQTGSFTVERTIDQSGLSSNYVSGVTDWNTYIGGSPFHTRNNSPANYYASFTNLPVNIDYDLGSSYNLLDLALWNYPFNNSGGIVDFNVFTSNVADFSSSFFAGNFTALDNGDSNISPLQTFDLTDSNSRYFRLNVLTTANANLGFAEIAFNTGNPVPEPGTMLLLGSGLLGLVVFRKKFRKN